MDTAIRNPQFAYFVVCANTDCFHLLHSITPPLSLSITPPFSTLDYTSIFYARLHFHYHSRLHFHYHSRLHFHYHSRLHFRYHSRLHFHFLRSIMPPSTTLVSHYFLKSNGKRPPSYASFSFTPSLPPNSPTNNAHITIYFIKQCALPTQNGAHINRRT